MEPGAVAVEVMRGGVVESVHRAHVAVCDAQGGLVRRAGDPDKVAFLRSAAKPFQALPLVLSGAADRFGLTPDELAVACASHQGEPEHARLVASMLAKGGLGPDALRCGTHELRSAKARASTATPGPLQHNCSGNHAGMLLLQAHLGGPASDYAKPDSAAQRAILAAVAEVAGLDPSRIARATDGCGVPAFGVPTRVGARMFARLAMPQGVSKPALDALGRVRDAMTRRPDLVGGDEHFDTDLMGASEDRLVAKAGAEGVQGVGDLASGLGLFLKVEDGSKRAVAPATVEALRQLAWIEGRAFEVLGDWWRPAVRGWGGAPVGEARPVLALSED